MMKFFLKIDKLSAWVLFFSMIVYGISGYAMTKGIFSPALANQLHMHLLGPVALLAFVFHTSFAIHLAFRRWKIWNKLTLVLLVLFYLSLAGFLVYLDSFYQVPPVTPYSSQTSDKLIKVVSPENVDSNLSVQTPASAEKTFTAQELSQYNGRSGQPSYVAVDGVVYDMSSVFRGGYHHGYQAGTDLSSAFHGQHSQSYLNGYQVVGKLK
jgi:predicted heme/steroid binding protein